MYSARSGNQINGDEMTTSREDYVILSEVLRKINLSQNYKPSAREHEVMVSLLEREKKDSPVKSKISERLNLEW